jgi:hypothetical protein
VWTRVSPVLPHWASAPVDPALLRVAMQVLLRLRACDPSVWGTGLSSAGARAAWAAALDALSPDMLARKLPGALPRRVGIVCSGNVFTAPLEWTFALTLRGVEVVLKPATGQEGSVAAIAAALSGLPGRVHVRAWRGGDETAEARGLTGCEAVIGFGGAEALSAIGGRLAPWRPAPRWLPFGPKAGVAVIRRLETATADTLALDHALYDGRGCMSPSAIFLVDGEISVLAEAMARAEAKMARGPLTPEEGAAIRARLALARVVGKVIQDDAWAVVELPVTQLQLAALPRVAVVHRVASLAQADMLVARHAEHIGTLATDAPEGRSARDPGARAPRVCAPGTMQRPPLARFHDGVDVLGMLAGA